MCCGKIKKVNTTMVYEDGIQLIYNGSKQVTFVSPMRNMYVFDNKNKQIQQVHPQDVDFLLTRKVKNFSLFSIYQVQEPVVEPEAVLDVLVQVSQDEDMSYEVEAQVVEQEEETEEPVKKTRRKKKEE
jgi:hypothetical protein